MKTAEPAESAAPRVRRQLLPAEDDAACPLLPFTVRGDAIIIIKIIIK